MRLGATKAQGVTWFENLPSKDKLYMGEDDFIVPQIFTSKDGKTKDIVGFIVRPPEVFTHNNSRYEIAGEWVKTYLDFFPEDTLERKMDEYSKALEGVDVKFISGYFSDSFKDEPESFCDFKIMDLEHTHNIFHPISILENKKAKDKKHGKN